METQGESLDRVVAGLREIGVLKPSPERRKTICDALLHKREGVQSVAAQVLGAWGGSESVCALRDWLSRLDERHEPFIGPRGVAIRELARCIGEQDANWALDLYFGQGGVLETHEYLILAASVDPSRSRSRIEAEVQSPDPVRRHAALKLANYQGLSDAADLARPLADDPDKDTRTLARHLIDGR